MRQYFRIDLYNVNMKCGSWSVGCRGGSSDTYAVVPTIRLFKFLNTQNSGVTVTHIRFLTFDSQHVSAGINHQIILTNAQLVTGCVNYNVSMEFIG
jgi:hypothetical protein